jgi:hypothetical protein
VGESVQRKRRPDAWEKAASLSDAQIWQAFAWAQALGYRKAARMIEAEFHCPAPGVSAMCDFYDYYAAEERANRIHKAATDVASIRAQATASGPLGEDLASALEQEASAAILAGADGARLKTLVGLALKARGSLRSDKSQELEIQKYRDSIKSAIERGLDALAEEIKGNAEAMALYEKFREAVRQGMATAEKAA